MKKISESASKREEKVKKLRILEIDEEIRNGGYPNATTLGKYFEVSRSTIMRDLDFLRYRYKAPLEYDSAKNGFYYSDPTFFIKSVMLSEGELFSISIIQPLLEQYRNTPIESSIKNIFTKLVELLPAEVSIDSSFVNNDISFIPDALPQIDDSVFSGIFKALHTKQKIIFCYRSLNNTAYSERSADPYHIICQKGNWYMLAFCHKHNEVRMFSLARMKDITVTKEKFTVQKGFNPKQYFDPSFGVWSNKEAPVKIELEFSHNVNTLITERTWHDDQIVKQNKDGTVYLSFMSNQIQETLHWVLGFGSDVKVINPPDLVKKVKEETQNILKKYK